MAYLSCRAIGFFTGDDSASATERIVKRMNAPLLFEHDCFLAPPRPAPIVETGLGIESSLVAEVQAVVAGCRGALKYDIHYCGDAPLSGPSSREYHDMKMKLYSSYKKTFRRWDDTPINKWAHPFSPWYENFMSSRFNLPGYETGIASAEFTWLGDTVVLMVIDEKPPQGDAPTIDSALLEQIISFVIHEYDLAWTQVKKWERE